MEEQPKYGVVVGVTEQPAPSGVVVGVLTEQPGASSGGAARGGLDAEKWVGRPPPLAPEDLYTGPRRDGLLSTEELSGDYRCCCFPFVCKSMSVVPMGADMIETWNTTCCFLPPMIIAPVAVVEVRTRKPGTNAFLNPQHPDPTSDLMTFSADGTAKQGGCGYKKRQTSQKRTFQKVDARDLAGKWLGCVCIPISLAWPFSPVFCITKKALNEDQYEESGCCCVLGLPPCPHRKLRTRNYVNGHPTNGFASDGGKMEICIATLLYEACHKRSSTGYVILWYRDPGCAAGPLFFAKKVG